MANLKKTIINDTGFIKLPVGSTAQRPPSVSAGFLRINNITGILEHYTDNWVEPDIGRTADAPVTGPVDLLTKNPRARSGTYWVDVNGTPTQTFFDMDKESGRAYMKVFEMTQTNRSGNNLVYDFNIVDGLGDSFSHTRLAYRMDWRGYYSWAAFDTDISGNFTRCPPADGSRAYTRNTNVSNLHVKSDIERLAPGLVTDNLSRFQTGRVTVWPSNYGTSGTFGDDTGDYDWDDSGFSTSVGYGCFQIFNMTTGPETIMAYNAHSQPDQDVGIGSNISGTHPLAPGGNKDWTFAYNSGAAGTNWKLTGYVW